MDEDCNEFSTMREENGADGSYKYEYTDSLGYTDSYETDASGNEVLGEFCVEDVNAWDYDWCYEDWIDVDGNHHHRRTDAEGNMCEETYYLDGTWNNCDGVHMDMEGREIIS